VPLRGQQGADWRLEARLLEFGEEDHLELDGNRRGFYLSAGYEELGSPRLSFFGKGLCYPMGKHLAWVWRRRTKRRDGL
jgi:hypothetical protein